MSRLLFAAARGARVQRREFNEREWWTAYDLDVNKGSAAPDCVYRIHPDDLHLQYGPVSTALRTFAETGKTPYTLTAMLAMAAYNHEKEYPFILVSEWPQASMFALILAEALADKGL